MDLKDKDIIFLFLFFSWRSPRIMSSIIILGAEFINLDYTLIPNAPRIIDDII